MECNLLSPLPCACVCARACACACVRVCVTTLCFGTQLSSQETATAALLKWGFFTDNQKFAKAPVSGQMKGLTPQGRNCCFFLFFCNTVQDPHLPPHTSSTPLLFSLAAPTHPAGTLSAIIHSAYSSVSSVFPHFLTKNVFFSLSFNFATNSSNHLPSLARLLQHTPQTVCVSDYFPL